MRLQRNRGLKAVVLAGTAGLIVAFFGLVRANPQISASAEVVPPAPDYERFFAPGTVADVPAERTQQAPHTRTRAS